MATLQEHPTTNVVLHNHNHEVVVVMVPLPAQGHLNQLLHLSHLISSSSSSSSNSLIPVHYAASATHIRQAKLRLHRSDDSALINIHFHDLPAPPFPSPPPVDPTAAAKTTRFPAHLQPALEAAASQLRHPIASLLRSLSLTARRLIVIHDSAMASAVRDFASLPNAESFSFHSTSAYATLSFRWLIDPKPIPPFLLESKDDLMLPEIESIVTPEFLRFIESQHEFLKLSSGTLYNTCEAMEAPFINLLEKEEPNRVWAIGPFNQVMESGLGLGRRGGRHKCLEWLDKQGENSVLYVSFGTTTSMAKDQIDEVAIGLERSGHKFIWVLRDADRGDVFARENCEEEKEEEEKALLLPKGFEERVKGGEMGMVVREWAPQVDILRHPATGGFMSHCGWNSCVESLALGVPIAAWPMHGDQPPNAVLVNKHLKVGVVVREWDRRSETVTRDEVKKTVRRLLASEEGEEMRRMAAELGGRIRRSAAEGGASRVVLGSFIAHITR